MVWIRKDKISLRKVMSGNVIRNAVEGIQRESGARLVFFYDEARFGLQPQIARQWALRGESVSAPIKTGYSIFYLYAAVDPKGW